MRPAIEFGPFGGPPCGRAWSGTPHVISEIDPFEDYPNITIV